MDIPEVPKVFFIRGVFTHTARSIREIIETQPTPVEQPPALLAMYEDWNDAAWLAQRAVRCATCPRLVGMRVDAATHPERQIFVPVALDRTRIGMAWKPHDTARFCSWPCAQYHIVYFLNNDSRFTQLLRHLYKRWEGRSVDEIAVAEHPWRCIELGGDRTLEELHRLNDFNMTRLRSSFDASETEEN